ncbi:MAG: penicillin-insensitive murein endopeptidase [Flavobacteriia bacterium]|nr:penicillin-insensitive murein endopeptidase [Flavobacteriia bacterium]
MNTKLLVTLTLTLLFQPIIGQDVNAYYDEHRGNDEPSVSIGGVSYGSLENGKLVPFQGDNYLYFDTTSYLAGRAYLNDKVLAAVLRSYEEMEGKLPNRQFRIMECSNAHGGRLWPHRTHQNGLSVDFMMPLVQNGEPYYELDNTGRNHYFLDFDDDGQYSEDESVSINFDLVAQHILILDEKAREQGMRITKVIINTDLKDELFATPHGRQLQNSDIYIVQRLSNMINALHDDHYHIDFAQ